jgi:antitoxin (DNA-binding transcriptional repressor) of toxin-antitoxin stability system
MEVSVGDALVRWQELIQRVEAGEEIILTRQGHAVVRMLPVQPSAVFDPKRRADFLRALSRKASAKAAPGAPAAQADQFLYGGGESSG